MKLFLLGLVPLLAACAPPGSSTDTRPTSTSAETLMQKWPHVGKLSVTSSSFPSAGKIPEQYSAYGLGVSPQLTWGGLPAGTVSVFVACEDPDAHDSTPFVHWMMANGSKDGGEVMEITPGRPGKLNAWIVGTTSNGTVGYFGPKPPIGDPPHHYHFEVFAVDKTLSLLDGFDRAAAVNALDGHVLASGEFVGVYQRG